MYQSTHGNNACCEQCKNKDQVVWQKEGESKVLGEA